MTFLETIASGAGKRLLIGGHRGHLSEVRENTLENFAQILGSGVDYIEIDVQLTADGQAVIYHDLDLGLHSPLFGRVRDYTVAQLKAAFALNTLDEVLGWCREQGMGVLLEIKSRELEMHDTMPVLAQRIVEALRRHDFFEMCIVFGTDHATLKRITSLEPRVRLALIVPHVPHDPVGLMKDMGAMIYLCFLDNLSAGLVEELHRAGYLVDGSVVNTRERLADALALRVDMIESDYPEMILGYYREFRKGGWGNHD